MYSDTHHYQLKLFSSAEQTWETNKTGSNLACNFFFFKTVENKRQKNILSFHQIGPLGKFCLVVAMSEYIKVGVSLFHVNFFKASHWPSDHMISLSPIIGQPYFAKTKVKKYRLNTENTDYGKFKIQKKQNTTKLK